MNRSDLCISLLLIILTLVVPCLVAGDHNTVQSVAPGKPFPIYRDILHGTNSLRVNNPCSCLVRVALRRGKTGITFDVPPSQARAISIPKGEFDVYFLYSDRADAAFTAEPIQMDFSSMELLLSTTERGGYSILERQDAR